MGIVENLRALKSELPDSVTLVAVSKKKPNEMVLEAYGEGHRDFGENRVQDLAARKPGLPDDIRWHMIGHLQSNKVKFLSPFVYMIHGVDSLKLLQVINKEAHKHNRIIDCLLQVHIAREETKYGFSKDELDDLVRSGSLTTLENIRIRGLMGMATFTENSEQIGSEFRFLKRIFDEIKASSYKDVPAFDQLSIGMSGDYRIAVEEGSTMVRIGSLIFGPRNLQNSIPYD